jgi:hypothetical protein
MSRSEKYNKTPAMRSEARRYAYFEREGADVEVSGNAAALTIRLLQVW